MAKTRMVVLKGYANWAKIFEQNRDLTGFDNQLADKGGQCTLDIDLDKENLAKLRQAGYKHGGNPSPDNEGHFRVRLKRKWEEQYGGGAPKVFKADGTTWDFNEDGEVGNGSVVSVIAQVYDTNYKGIIGCRLEEVKVDEHKAYVTSRMSFGNPSSVREDDSTPKDSTSKDTKAKAKVELDDEIPF